MYDVFVVANFDSSYLRKRYEEIRLYTRVEFIFDRHATRIEQYPDAIARSGLIPTTEYYFVVPGYQEFINKPFDWLIYDLESPAIVSWPVRTSLNTPWIKDGHVEPNMGICLFPADAHEKTYPRVVETTPHTACSPFPTIYQDFHEDVSRLDHLKDIAKWIEHPYFHVVPMGISHDIPKFPLFDPEIPGYEKNPIYISTISRDRRLFDPREYCHSENGILTIPTGICDSQASGEYLIHQGGWPTTKRGCAFDNLSYGKTIPYDIFMLTNGESNADHNWALLKKRFPYAKRIDRVKGILNAHVEAAFQAQTDYFWVIDADNVLYNWARLEEYHIPLYAPTRLTVWHALNLTADLEYGYGGIKLFPRDLVREMKHAPMDRDFTSMVARRCGLEVIKQCWSETVIASTPYEAFRAGYREASKLQAWLYENQEDHPLYQAHKERLKNWISEASWKTIENNGIYTVWGACFACNSVATMSTYGHLGAIINDDSYIRKLFDDNCESFDSDSWRDTVKSWQESF